MEHANKRLVECFNPMLRRRLVHPWFCGDSRAVSFSEMMKIKQSLLMAVAAGLLFSGCATDPGRTTAAGAGLGAAIGAAAGAIIGNQSGEAGKGALVGAGVGGLIGAGVGNAKEAKEKEAAKPKE
jgi:hypothetical protein